MVDSKLLKIPDYSIVILCYQAEEYCRVFVAEVIENISKLNIDYELILVANYWENSNDQTPRIAQELRNDNEYIKVVALAKKGGMSWDMISGLKACTGRVIAVIDGDGQMPAYDLVRVYKKLKDENLDFVKTYRTKREDNCYRNSISVVYNFIFRILFPGLSVRDVNSKPKIFTREVYQKLNLTSSGWFVDAEIMIQVRRLHLKIGEISTFFKLNTRSSYVKFEAIWEFIKNLIKVRICEFKTDKKVK
ncbi:MAG: glycosyltransferase family 2 protein [Candidatus Omnitrophota bacterium]